MVENKRIELLKMNLVSPDTLFDNEIYNHTSFIKDLCTIFLRSTYGTLSMLNFNVWVCGVNLGGWGGREGGFFMLLFLMLFFRIQS